MDNDIEAENNSSGNNNDLIIDNEQAEEVFVSSINEMTEKYKDFRKISRYNYTKKIKGKII